MLLKDIKSLKQLKSIYGDDPIILPNTESNRRSMVQASNSMQFFRHNNGLWMINMCGINGYNGVATKEQIMHLAPRIAASFAKGEDGELASTMFRTADDKSVVATDLEDPDVRDGSQASQDHGLDQRRIISPAQMKNLQQNFQQYEEQITSLLMLRAHGIVSNQPQETSTDDKGNEVMGVVDRVLSNEAKRVTKRADEEQESNAKQSVALGEAQSEMATIYTDI